MERLFGGGAGRAITSNRNGAFRPWPPRVADAVKPAQAGFVC